MWKAAVMSGDAAQIEALARDPARVQVKVQGDHQATFATEAAHWAELKKEGLVSYSPEIDKVQSPQPGLTLILLNSELKFREKTRYEQEAIAFVSPRESGPNLVFVGRERMMFLPPLKELNPKLYDEQADARREIEESLKADASDHKRTVLVFGANWCYDCHVLDAMFHQPDIAPTVTQHFRVVHVDIGRGEKNIDLAQKYGLNIERGVPALAVVDANDHVIFADKEGQFEAARSMDPEKVLAYLKQWER